MTQKLEITTMNAKGHVTIPPFFRKTMGIKTNTKFVVMRMGNVLVMKEMDVPNMEDEIDRIFKKIGKKRTKIPDKDIVNEIKKYRRKNMRKDRSDV